MHIIRILQPEPSSQKEVRSRLRCRTSQAGGGDAVRTTAQEAHPHNPQLTEQPSRPPWSFSGGATPKKDGNIEEARCLSCDALEGGVSI